MSLEIEKKTEEKVVIDVTLREGTGKGVARKIRQQSLKAALIPGNFLNFNGKSTSITLDTYALDKALANKEKQFTISLEGKTHLVQLKELQLHPVKRFPMHIDITLVK